MNRSLPLSSAYVPMPLQEGRWQATFSKVCDLQSSSNISWGPCWGGRSLGPAAWERPPSFGEAMLRGTIHSLPCTDGHVTTTGGQESRRKKQYRCELYPSGSRPRSGQGQQKCPSQTKAEGQGFWTPASSRDMEGPSQAGVAWSRLARQNKGRCPGEKRFPRMQVLTCAWLLLGQGPQKE